MMTSSPSRPKKIGEINTHAVVVVVVVLVDGAGESHRTMVNDDNGAGEGDQKDDEDMDIVIWRGRGGWRLAASLTDGMKTVNGYNKVKDNSFDSSVEVSQ